METETVDCTDVHAKHPQGPQDDDVFEDVGSAAKKLKATEHAEEKTEVVVAASPSRRKSKRRSSFVLGRIQTCYPTDGSPGLTKDLPSSLPQAERLAKLSKVALQYTLDKLGSELPDLEAWQQFRVEASDQANSVITQLQEEGVFHQATEKTGLISNPANVQLQKGIQDLENYTERLNTETREWDALVDQRTTKADEAEKQGKSLESDPNPILSDIEELTAEQRNFLHKDEDLNARLSDLKHMKEKAVLAVDQVEQVCKTLQAFTSTAKTVLGKQANILHVQSFDTLESSPKTLIAAALTS